MVNGTRKKRGPNKNNSVAGRNKGKGSDDDDIFGIGNSEYNGNFSKNSEDSLGGLSDDAMSSKSGKSRKSVFSKANLSKNNKEDPDEFFSSDSNAELDMEPEDKKKAKKKDKEDEGSDLDLDMIQLGDSDSDKEASNPRKMAKLN